MDMDGLGFILSTAILAAVANRVLLLRDNCLLSVMAYYKFSKQASAVHYTVMT